VKTGKVILIPTDNIVKTIIPKATSARNSACIIDWRIYAGAFPTGTFRKFWMMLVIETNFQKPITLAPKANPQTVL